MEVKNPGEEIKKGDWELNSHSQGADE